MRFYRHRMIIVYDTREQRPLSFKRYKKVDGTSRITLKTGDYSVRGYEDKISIERKSAIDLFGTLGKGSERFKKELLRARDLDFFGMVIESPYDEIRDKTFKNAFRSKMRGDVILKRLHTMMVKYRMHVFFARSRSEATGWIVRTFDSYIRFKEKEDSVIRKVLQT